MWSTWKHQISYNQPVQVQRSQYLLKYIWKQKKLTPQFSTYLLYFELKQRINFYQAICFISTYKLYFLVIWIFHYFEL